MGLALLLHSCYCVAEKHTDGGPKECPHSAEEVLPPGAAGVAKRCCDSARRVVAPEMGIKPCEGCVAKAPAHGIPVGTTPQGARRPHPPRAAGDVPEPPPPRARLTLRREPRVRCRADESPIGEPSRGPHAVECARRHAPEVAAVASFALRPSSGEGQGRSARSAGEGQDTGGPQKGQLPFHVWVRQTEGRPRGPPLAHSQR